MKKAWVKLTIFFTVSFVVLLALMTVFVGTFHKIPQDQPETKEPLSAAAVDTSTTSDTVGTTVTDTLPPKTLPEPEMTVTKEDTETEIPNPENLKEAVVDSAPDRKIDSLETLLANIQNQNLKLEKALNNQEKENEAPDTSAPKPDNSKKVAKIYEKMPPQQAARLLANLKTEMAATIIASMRQRQAAKILASMDPDKAVVISKVIAHSPGNLE